MTAILGTGERGSGLDAACALPHGGLVRVDLLQPLEALDLYLPEGSAADATLPEDWARLALVTGVDRWLDVPVDEGLVAADRVLAAREAGLDDEADGWVPVALPSLLRMVTRAVDAPAPDALRRELVRVTAAFGDALDAPARRLVAGLGAAPAAQSWSPGEEEVRRRRQRPRPAVAGIGAGPQASSRVPSTWTAHLDPRRVPARLCGWHPEVVRRDGLVVVEVDAAPGITPDHPAAGRLLATLTRGGGTEAMSPMVLEDGRFRCWFREAEDSGLPLIEVVDVLSPDLGEELSDRLSEIDAVGFARDAWVSLREATTWTALADEAGAALALDDAAAALDRATAISDDPRSLLESARTLGRGTSAAPATRPLLSELAYWGLSARR